MAYIPTRQRKKTGGAQKIQFSAYEFTERDKTASRKVHGLSFDLVAEEEIHVYLTTPHSNGTFAMCWADAEKKVGIQAKHKVTRVEPGGKEAAIFVIDFPLRSLRAVKKALAIIRSNEFKLDLD